MQAQHPSRLLRLTPHISILLAVALLLCVVGGAPTAAIAAAERCQPQAVTADFCTKVTKHSDVLAVVPDAVVSANDSGRTPHLLSIRDPFTHALPGYLTTPSGRSPPLLS
jgi:hypothetical protein